MKTIWIGAAALIVGYFYEEYASSRDAKRYPPPGRLVDMGGRQIHLLCKGDVVGPAVVIEPGAGERSDSVSFAEAAGSDVEHRVAGLRRHDGRQEDRIDRDPISRRRLAQPATTSPTAAP